MGAFGDRLRREREMRGITLEEIMESTKISRRHLEALEGEHFDRLPGGVFNKGFIRAYARFLGIDEDQAVADYSAATSTEQPEAADKFPLEIHDQPDPHLIPRRSYLLLAFVVAALAGVLVGYGFWVKSKPHGAEKVDATIQPPSAAATNETPPANASTPVASSAPTAAPPAVVEPAAVAPPVTAQQQTAPDVPAAAEPAEKEKAFFVSVKAKEDSWVSIVADGKSVMDRVLGANKHKNVKAGKTLILRTGNAGGIEVSFNGRSLGPLGNENEPRTLTFNVTGLVQ